MEPNKENILALNLLRFFAAGLVFVDHYYSNLVASGYILPLLDSSLFRYLGFFGVATFFIISGFVISLSSENKTTSEFIASRFVRLFPVFWVCVSITVFIVIVFGHSSIDSILSMRYVRNLTMLPQLLWNEPYIDNVYWTLQTELKFYFIIIAFITLKIIQKGRLEKIAFFTSLALLFDCFYHVSFFNNALFAYCSDVVHLFLQNNSEKREIGRAHV